MNKLNLTPSVFNRFSPRDFSEKQITEQDLKSLFEAARWAASCYNEQPWRFIYATTSDTENFNQILNCLVPGNQEMAKKATALICTVAKNTFTQNQKDNIYAWHDVGLAVGNLSAQATSMGIYLHQMAGFIPNKAVTALNIPKNFTPVSILGLGYLQENFELDNHLKKREQSKVRITLSEIMFNGKMN